MTRKHFEATAAMLKQERTLARTNGDPGAIGALAAVAVGMAHIFAEANPRFDREKFLDAARP